MESSSDNNGVGIDNHNKWIQNKFSKEESILVKEAVAEYCAKNRISIERLCTELAHKGDLKGAWREIAKCLPHRTPQSVYRHGLRILHPFKRGSWTEEEEVELYDLVQRHGRKWAKIQKILNRSADSCRDKYKIMRRGEEFVKGRWDEEETSTLQNIIRQVRQ